MIAVSSPTQEEEQVFPFFMVSYRPALTSKTSIPRMLPAKNKDGSRPAGRRNGDGGRCNDGAVDRRVQDVWCVRLESCDDVNCDRHPSRPLLPD